MYVCMRIVSANVFVPFTTLRTGEKNDLKGSGLGRYLALSSLL